jgi:hypothetical protein
MRKMTHQLSKGDIDALSIFAFAFFFWIFLIPQTSNHLPLSDTSFSFPHIMGCHFLILSLQTIIISCYAVNCLFIILYQEIICYEFKEEYRISNTENPIVHIILWPHYFHVNSCKTLDYFQSPKCF